MSLLKYVFSISLLFMVFQQSVNFYEYVSCLQKERLIETELLTKLISTDKSELVLKGFCHSKVSAKKHKDEDKDTHVISIYKDFRLFKKYSY
ncbi:hypothetical protein OAT67_04020 [Bacteriovoracaceae bacterium]|nr:hypothetical protein [Bacteriovoracaceae bacterium]